MHDGRISQIFFDNNYYMLLPLLISSAHPFERQKLKRTKSEDVHKNLTQKFLSSNIYRRKIESVAMVDLFHLEIVEV